MLNSKEITWIIDHATGALTVEGLTDRELSEVANDVLPGGAKVNCARPINIPPLYNIASSVTQAEDESLQVFRIYHGSVVEGPGRRSVAQLSGCPLNCVGCFSTETHPYEAGVRMSNSEVVTLLLDPTGEPRDGVTVLGGEPFVQPDGLAALLHELKERGLHVTLYSGYTLEELMMRPEPSVREALVLADILIDGRFIAAQAKGAGEWRGSRNQRIINKPAQFLTNKCSEGIKSVTG
ncbi:MAG: radical SAM protein [Pyrinomonadaceae bacterium MAG19_C2-C3]|nr:radical SAM protein [Pyrinomonadaceae bacterium MAG19_C2-C3]